MVSLDDSEFGLTPLCLNDLPVSELVAMIKELQLQTSGLQAELRGLNSVRPTPELEDQPADPLAEHQATFSELGKRFCILSELWANENVLERPYPTAVPEGGPWSVERYDGTIPRQDAVTAEIYACVPEEFHRLIQISPLFSSTFITGMGDMRAYVIDSIHKHAASIFGIAGLNGSEFRTLYDRSTVPQFTELLKSPNAPEEQFATYPRILYEDNDTEKLPFGGQVVINILRAIFLGPTSVGKSGWARRSGPRPLAMRLGLTSITPGAIAAAGIMARFIISPDTVFAVEGNKTSIKYREDFERYKTFLIKHAQTDAIKWLIKKLNADVLQIHDNDAGDLTSAAIPYVAEEDLVIQALFKRKDPEGEVASTIGTHTAQQDNDPPTPSPTSTSQPGSSRLRIIPHISSSAEPVSPEGLPSLSQLATDPEEGIESPDPPHDPPQARHKPPVKRSKRKGGAKAT